MGYIDKASSLLIGDLQPSRWRDHQPRSTRRNRHHDLPGQEFERNHRCTNSLIVGQGSRALLRHTALCFVVAGALGGGAARLMHLFDLSTIARYGMVSVCVATSFAIFWGASDGPRRWRPFTISSKLADGVFGAWRLASPLWQHSQRAAPVRAVSAGLRQRGVSWRMTTQPQ